MERRNFLKISGLSAISTTLFGEFPNIFENLPKDKKQKIVIVGSGATALCLGALLAKEGHKIIVLEAHPNLLGGHSRTLEFQGLKYSGGPEYSWNFGEGQIGHTVLKYLGLTEKVPFLSMNETGFERVMIEGKPFFDVPIGLDKYEARLIEKFPKQTVNIHSFFQALTLIHQVIMYMHDKGLYMKMEKEVQQNIMLTTELSFKAKKMLAKIGHYTLKQVFEKYNLSQEVREILYGYGGVFLENEDKMAFAIYAGGIGYYHLGAYYPKFGYESLIQNLGEIIKESGGEIYTNQKVIRMEYENHKIHKIYTKEKVWEADSVISALSPRLTYQLVEKFPDPKFEYKPSNGVTAFYLGINKDAEMEETLKGRSIWWKSKTTAMDFEKGDIHTTPAMIYIASTSAKGYGGNPNLTALTILIESDFEAVKEIYLKGETVYAIYKKEIQEKVMKVVEQQIFPDFQAKIQFCEVFTPYDCYLETGSENGNAYGKKLTPENIFLPTHPKVELENLTIACATIGLPGIAICLNTAQLLFTQMTGKKVKT
jgi:all-trans-retinol 13,14-reductase